MMLLVLLLVVGWAVNHGKLTHLYLHNLALLLTKLPRYELPSDTHPTNGNGYNGSAQQYNGYGQHGPYGDGSYGGQGAYGTGQDGEMPVVRDLNARRTTRLNQGGQYGQQGNSGIAQNF